MPQHKKATKILIAEGDRGHRGKEQLRRKLEAEPKFTEGLGECPEYLNEKAREMWQTSKAELERCNMGVCTDAPILEGCAKMYSIATDCDETVSREGLLVKMSNGEYKPHPLIIVSQNAWKLVKSFCSEMGFGPVSRSRVAIEKQSSVEEDLAEILAKPRTQES